MDAMFREAEASDWPGIRALLEATPMTSALPLVFSRAADHALAYPAAGGRSVGWVAVRGERVVAYAHVRLESCRVGASRERLAYCGDLRVDASQRGTGLGAALMQQLCTVGESIGARAGLCLVNEGNAPVLRLLLSGRGGVRAKVVRTFVTGSRLLWRRPAPGPGLLVRASPSADLSALAASISSAQLGPETTAAGLQGLLERYPEIQLYRRASSPEPVLGLWDASRARQLKLARLSLPLRGVRAVWEAARRVTGAPPFMRAGEAWRSAEVTLCAPGVNPADFEADLAAEAYQLGAHTLMGIESGLGGGAAFRGPTIRLRTHLVTFAVGSHALPEIPKDQPVHVELGSL